MARRADSNRNTNLRNSINEESNASLSYASLQDFERRLKDRERIERKYRKRIEDFTEKEKEEVLKRYSKKVESEFTYQAKKFTKNIASGLLQAMGNTVDIATDGVRKYLSTYQTGFTNITTRLIGSGKDYNNILKSIQQTLGGTRATSVSQVLTNLNKLVSQGISYNVEQRSFLSSISEKIAATFDAANGTLTRLIRLNRTDMTGAYLGMESALTKFFNTHFSDTSFLASGLSEQVSNLIYSATAQLGAQEGAALEYQIQKYLGSFYASGVSESTITNIASALGALGSGDLTGLTSNAPMMTLLTTGAKNAGQSLSDILIGGLTSDSVSQIMQGIYTQAMQIGRSGDNVSQQQLASMFGMNITDLKAISNLSDTQLQNMNRANMTYGNMLDELTLELGNVRSRTSQVEMIENILDNVLGRAGHSIASNPETLLTYQILDKLGSINIFGTDVVGVGKNAILGMGLLSNIPEMIGMLRDDGFGQAAYVTGDDTSMTMNTIMSQSASELEIVANHTAQTNTHLQDILEEVRKGNQQSDQATSSSSDNLTGITMNSAYEEG